MSAWPIPDAARPVSLRDAEALAERARELVATPDSAIRLRAACDAARVRLSSRPLPVGARRHTAMLLPFRDGFHALIDSLLWERARVRLRDRWRLRFVVAHELGHTLFYRPGRPPTRTTEPDRLEERFCHRFATSLLVPPGEAARTSLDPAGLFELAKRFEVSERVAAWSIARARPSVSVLWLARAEHPHRGGEERMRVQWAASSRFIASGESFKSPLAELAPGEEATSVERLRLAGQERAMSLSAWRFTSAMLVIARHLDERLSAPAGTPFDRRQLAFFY